MEQALSTPESEAAELADQYMEYFEVDTDKQVSIFLILQLNHN